MLWVLLILAVAGISCLFTFALRRYALSNSLIDIPNARSSHSVPTPRGGGVAIVVVFLVALLLTPYIGDASWHWVGALAGGGALVAVVGFLDDHGHIAARWRLMAHFVAAAWALLWLEGELILQLPGLTLSTAWLVYGLATFFLVWLLNLYNFMDGIDGIASVEAMSVCLGGALIYWLLGHHEKIPVLLLLAAAVGGFLFWNFPRARIFMGDAGSGFLGLILGVLAVTATMVEPQLLWSWLILLGVFIFDATWTLFRRLARGDKFYEAHRSHAYQYASSEFGAHLPVTLGVLVINLAWLLPWACLVALGYVNGLLGLLIAYVPLAFLAVRFKAGALEMQA